MARKKKKIGADGYVIKGESAMAEILGLLKARNKKGKVPVIAFSVIVLILAIYLVLQFFF